MTTNETKPRPKVVVVGVGALGSHLALLLRNEHADLTVIDYDRVEAKNTLAQMHAKQSIGKNKAEALKASMAFLYGTKLHAVPHKLTADNVDALLGAADLVVDCLDNGEARRVVQECVRDGFERVRAAPALLHGALAADGSFGRVVWDQHFVIDDEDVAGQPTCEGGEHLPFIAMAASTLAYAAQQYLRHGKRLSYQLSPAGMQRLG